MRRKLPFISIRSSIVIIVLTVSILFLIAIPLASAQSSWTETSDSDFNDGTLENTEVVSDDVRILEVSPDDWTQATSNASWSGRSGHASVVFSGSMWVLGGFDGSSENDVWYSSDGSSWSQATSNAAWPERWGHTSVAYDGKMWVLGGKNSSGGKENDVWYSPDGSSWSQATSNAAWPARHVHSSVTLVGKMWILGGISDPVESDVWYSSDGSSWSQATSNASWDGRFDFASIAYSNKMWIMGGRTSSWVVNDLSDVWYSSYGSSWTQATSDASWPARSRHTSVTYNGKMWVLGGENDDTRFNDIWYSSDGSSWTKATSSADWSARSRPTSVVYDNKIWVIGGYDGALKNDVWWWAPYRESGAYVSSDHDTGTSDTVISKVSWNASGSDLSVQVAAGNSPNPSNWEYVSNGDTSIGANGRYIRYRAIFDGTGLSDDPELDEITIDYAYPTSLSCDVDDSNPDPGQEIGFSGYLKDSGGSGIGGKTVKLYKNGFDTGLTTTTESDGYYGILAEASSSSGVDNYYVRFAGDDPYLSSESSEFSVTVGSANSLPSADFSYTSDGLTVDFSDSSSDSDGSIDSWSWDFDDGNTSTQQNPLHSYSSSGDYTVELTVTDDEGASSTVSKTITVSEGDQSPTADFSYSIDNLTVSFSDGSSDSDGSIDSWSWDFDGDGTEDETVQNPSFTYSSGGSYDVTLTVTDDDGLTDEKTKTVSVSGGETGQTVKVSGYVKSDGEPIEGATVTIGEENTKTESDGYYAIEGLEGRNEYDITVEKSDYESYSGKVTVGYENKTQEIDLNEQSEGGINMIVIATIIIIVIVVVVAAVIFLKT